MRALHGAFPLNPRPVGVDTADMAPFPHMLSQARAAVILMAALLGQAPAQAAASARWPAAIPAVGDASTDAGPASRQGSNRLPAGAILRLEVAPHTHAHVQLGRTRDTPLRLPRTPWSLGVEFAGSLTGSADVYGDDQARPVFEAGIGWMPAERARLGISALRRLDGSRDHQLRLRLTLGF